MNNPKIVMTKGLPGSGKTTWAMAEMAAHPSQYKRINKDDLRAMLDGGKWSKNNEKFILDARDVLVEQALKQGFTAIVDDTNFAPNHEIVLRGLAGDLGLAFEIKDFTDVPPEECIKRDLKREKSVGKDVIMDMYDHYLKPKPEPITQDVKLPDAVMFDLDGTLALFGDANPYEREFAYDTVNYPVYDALRLYQAEGYKIIVCSGRNGKFFDDTDKWLGKNGIKPDLFLMRKEGDTRKDYIVKKEMFLEHILPKYCVSVVYDDRDQVVEMWREMGLACFQVNYGDF